MEDQTRRMIWEENKQMKPSIYHLWSIVLNWNPAKFFPRRLHYDFQTTHNILINTVRIETREYIISLRKYQVLLYKS